MMTTIAAATGCIFLGFYLLIANVAAGPGGDQKAYKKGKQRFHELVQVIKGETPTEQEDN